MINWFFYPRSNKPTPMAFEVDNRMDADIGHIPGNSITGAGNLF